MEQNIVEWLDVRDKVQINAITIDSTAAVTLGPWAGPATVGIYYMWADCDCYLTVSSTSGNVVSANIDTGLLLNARNTVTIQLNSGDYISARAASGQSGKVRFMLVDRLF